METRENLCSDPTNLEIMRFAVPPVVQEETEAKEGGHESSCCS